MERDYEKRESYATMALANLDLLKRINERKGSADCLRIAFNVITKAIEKLTPKEPTEICEGYYEMRPVTIGTCPRCGTHVNFVDNFCPYCGQALKWPEQEEE